MRRQRPARPRVKLNRDAVWALLDQLGISQNELARRCGLSPGYLSLLMAGKRSPSARTRRRLLLKGRLWSRVWLLPESWPEPKPNLEVTHHAPS